MKIIDQDIIFLSYDEPNAEKNYADLCSKAPWAKRVHGVEGSDAAHKACSDLSETENFITIDGDTIIDPKFLQVELDLEKLKATPEFQFSWAGNIDVNGLKYGNGSIKMWTLTSVNFLNLLISSYSGVVPPFSRLVHNSILFAPALIPINAEFTELAQHSIIFFSI